MEKIIIIGAIIGIVFYLISKFNYFKTSEQQIKREKSGIDVALTRRHDELQKMQDSVKGIMKHEKEVLVEVVQVRNGMSVQEMAEAESQMDRAYSQLMALAESYPQITSSANFLKLQDSISTNELELQAARRCYNATVTEFNQNVVSFPTNLLAKLFKVETADVFEATPEKREDIKLEF